MTADDSPITVIGGSSYLQEQEESYRSQKEALAWPVAVLWAVVVCVGILQFVLPFFRLPILPFWSVLILIAIAGGTSALLPIIEQLERKEGNFATGRAGEQKLAELLDQHLGRDWTLYRNIVLPDGKGDIDAVLVGPQGIYTLEVKAYSGEYFNQGATWKKKRGSGWMVLKYNPTRQILWNTKRLRAFLTEQGIEATVQPRVVWAGEGRLRFSKPVVPIWFLQSPAFIVQDVNKGDSLAESKQAQAVTALSQLNRRSGPG